MSAPTAAAAAKDFVFTPEQVSQLETKFCESKFIKIFEIEQLNKTGKNYYPADKVQEWFRKQRLDSKFHSKLHSKLDSKLDSKFDSKLDSKLNSKLDSISDQKRKLQKQLKMNFEFNKVLLEDNDENDNFKEDRELNKRFTEIFGLKTLTVITGTGIRMFSCDKCEEVFERTLSLHTHKYTEHDD